MNLYNTLKIRNTILLESLREWKQQDWIADAPFVEAWQKLSPHYKRAMWWVRVGLFVLALILVAAVFGLLGLMLDAYSQNIFSKVCILFGALGLGASFYFIKKKEYFKNGIDHGLIYANLLIFCVGIDLLFMESFDSNGALAFLFFLNFIIVLGVAIYTVDWLLILIAFALLGASIINSLMALHGTAFTYCFYLFIIIIFICYKWIVPKIFKTCSIIYEDCINASRAALFALITVGLNVFVQDSLMSELAYSQELKPHTARAFAIIIMFAWPLYVLISNIKQRNILLVLMGLLGLVVAFITITLYVYNWNEEWVLLTSGILCLLLAAVGLLLAKSKPLLFSLEPSPNDFTKINQIIGNLTMIQTATNVASQASPPPTDFGGGQFGGAGAHGEF